MFDQSTVIPPQISGLDEESALRTIVEGTAPASAPFMSNDREFKRSYFGVLCRPMIDRSLKGQIINRGLGKPLFTWELFPCANRISTDEN